MTKYFVEADMARNPRNAHLLSLLALLVTVTVTGCGGKPAAPTATPTPVPTTAVNLPAVTGAQLDRTEVPRYESFEMTVSLKAEYTNPYDAREVSLDGVFTAPDGTQMNVPGFWDGEGSWRVRFTPSQEGEWSYQLVVREPRGASLPYEGQFTVTASDLHGWLQVGSWVNPAYSSRYLVYQDGTPFYGVGHCDALSVLLAGFSLETGVGLFSDMKQSGENYVVWWPQYSNPL